MAGYHIDDDAVVGLLAEAVLVIVHNADFDRRFLERRLPIFATKRQLQGRARTRARRAQMAFTLPPEYTVKLDKDRFA